ncbi:hypothetical protein Sme01_59920 [Sphaerisporangium melleum]|uniref:Pilus assembly protein TadE n=1 Tax=Sphaerisporangium melleum TaxID=321316 RepID=A0A917VNF2_9ACTN|nr:TadE family type IV pilus minor pilin [Sphaerisporangium melleum]GGK98714.1 hypothetical protein GCM10007964_46110 [Sphaerisporangium melleum]GII73516.1 hypothetical protein Sme01_59920 [Sphaerisporangium melleum]
MGRWNRRDGRCSESGSVTAETAVALPALALVLGAALWAVAAVAAQVQCVDAAWLAARAAARGEALEAVDQAARRAAPAGAAVSVSRDVRLTRVAVSVLIRPSWAIGMPPISIQASATAATEWGATDGLPGPDEEFAGTPHHEGAHVLPPEPPRSASDRLPGPD